MVKVATLVLAVVYVLAAVRDGRADEVTDSTPVAQSLKVVDGFAVEPAASSPLVERPIVAAFDDDGRLYVAESSGSNDPVEKQLKERPHRVVRLEDTDADGRFDRRTVFADRMMFPEGVMWFDGSVYVSAPPSIWKLTDRDGDGVADERVEWFQGKTLTGCANDLHGPYAGPDGWIYWCKGAFAEQTHIVNGREWKTLAAHIFRCRPDGSGFEPVLTGGMDNPVDVAFTPEGERILSATFLESNPRRDGLVHAIYGGVYGKDHGVLAGHPRTGELMPAIELTNSAAPCGLARYDSDVFGNEYRDNFFLCDFNMRRVSRHILTPAGSSYKAEASNFVWSDNVDFHPTDVVVDADGSLLIIDTGGWYKLCCPTSQLWKPDVLGGIYRVRRTGARPTADPRGRGIKWAEQKPAQLWAMLADRRATVRQRAGREFVSRKNSPGLQSLINVADGGASNSTADEARTASARMWAISQLETPGSRQLIRERYLNSPNEAVQHAALLAVGLHRDTTATQTVARILRETKSAANRRAAAEALGRIGDSSVVPALLTSAAEAEDRILQHSIVYALIELAQPATTRSAGLSAMSPKTVAAALIALDQMPKGELQAKEVTERLGAQDETLHAAARWILLRHPEWGDQVTEWLRARLNDLSSASQHDAQSQAIANLKPMLVAFSGQPGIQELLASTATADGASVSARELALTVMAAANTRDVRPNWTAAMAAIVAKKDSRLLPLALTAIRGWPKIAEDADLRTAVLAIADDPKNDAAIRVQALSIVAGKLSSLSDAQFQTLKTAALQSDSVPLRAGAAEAISQSKLNNGQLGQLCDAVRSAGPLEINRFFTPFALSSDDALGLRLVAALRESSNGSAVRIDLLREALAKHGTKVKNAIDELESLVHADAAVERKRIEELLPLAKTGDVRRGHAIFNSAKAACSSCHRMGYAGGTTGPELSHVGETRTERDLLESILFPSLSFVRSYEPMLIITQNGKTINGVIRDEVAGEYVVATGPDQVVRVPRADVEQLQPSTISIMPAGLDKQLTTQELMDLVAFLKNTAEHK